ncbi:hypothetical protein ACERK3_14845 [Phycisphaerales bacterium AB-hyl4]|uniref:Uncharacterized protein n=1 Tax=Natronomicrosphaera hydrolytica TaxID=3242702 RepID=A0ABV4U7I5_9BACT
MPAPRPDRLSQQPPVGPADDAAIERQLQREARALVEPADEARVQAIMHRLAHESAPAAAGPPRRVTPWRLAAVGLAAACVLVGAFVAISSLTRAPDTAIPLVNQPPAADPAPSTTPTTTTAAGDVLRFPDPLDTGRAADLWAQLELQAEWNHLRMDAARFVGPLAFAAGPAAFEPDTPSP